MAPYFGTVSVIGLGTTGSALTAVLAANGLRVDTIEQDTNTLRHGRARVKAAIAALGLPADDETETQNRVNYTTGPTLLPRADLVIEAVSERLRHKAEVLRHADSVCPASTIFATTTSGLAVTDVAARSGRMVRTVGLHLCHPGQVTDGTATELVLTPVTDADVRREMAELVHRLGKTPVCVADRPGLLGAGLFLGYLNSAAAMYEQNYASRDDIDSAMIHGGGLRVGPLAQLDTMGLDIVLDSLCALADRTGDAWYTPTTILRQMVDAGLLGRKSGRGFHRYDAEDDLPGYVGDDRATGDGRPVPQ